MAHDWIIRAVFKIPDPQESIRSQGYDKISHHHQLQYLSFVPMPPVHKVSTLSN